MKSRWSKSDAAEFVKQHAPQCGEDLAIRAYSSRLIGNDPSLVLHGGGNTSVKGQHTNILGEKIPAIYVKASGQNLADATPDGHTGLDITYLQKLRVLDAIDDDEMVNELRQHAFAADAATASIEALLHAFIPAKFIDHTHADAILSLTNQKNGEKLIRNALGDKVIILPYVKPGFTLSKAAADAFDKQPDAKGMVLMQHGLITWGESAQNAYEATIKLVDKAESYLKKYVDPMKVKRATNVENAMARFAAIAPELRGRLALESGNADQPYRPFILRPLITKEVLDFVDADQGKAIARTPPLTSDHLIRTKPFPMWVESPDEIPKALEKYTKEYDKYYDKYAEEDTPERFDPMPRVILMPGVGAICIGRNIKEAEIVRDITAQTLAVKTNIAGAGLYEGLSEKHLFDMEYFPQQHAKLNRNETPLERKIALVSGAAGAIGSGICRGLLEQGCHVAATDLPGDHLDSLVNDLAQDHGQRIIGVPMDVTSDESVTKGMNMIIGAFGGVDLFVINAGLAHVASLAEMKMENFQRLQRVNVDGTLRLLAEASRHFKTQNIGGDIVLISTKNVFCPGARFGAYSATKAASHQLARIASLELADIGVRVNMVSPDGVFADGARPSGLWAEVGPDRMKARNLDADGLQSYYQNRNMLKARITARHVANAVLYYATRQSPTTGATIPVDGGLPDSTPR
ncbi:MAG: bifunctional aldolase/short-chain dehydrogenase [Magnetococcales bacterium]|nr:bifunctional aldolase/short-chain dehydrogenase [Magnetococcales bacterium]